MIKSMTGFGSIRSEKDGHSLSVDIKCLNSKFMDINLRIPKEVQDKEAELRKLLNDELSRGKVQLSIELQVQNLDRASDIIDKELFDKYFNTLSSIADKHNADKSELFRLAMQMPDVIKSGDQMLDENLWAWIKSNVVSAIEKANQFRMDEGKSLQAQFDESLNNLYRGLEEVESLDSQRRKRLSEKLKDALEELKDKVRVDENRFEQELIYYMEKLDISEEKVRLKTHLDYFQSTLAHKDSNGKRLQFISQEIGREINTIGSKANDAELQKIVVGMKDELEKIKEQSLNVL
ncbi:YicC family protein [Hyphobacterium sp. CCMP332]|nr:YicC family protein [Hyphobacterium sp. CCMP332]